MRSRLLRAGAAAALCVLGGCRTAPPLTFPAAAPWEVRRPQLQALGRFELRGRVAVAAGKEGFNANLHWMQQGAHSQLTLQGPLGAGAVQVSATDSDLEIVTGNGTHLDSAAARAELAARLGFDPPLPSLRYWILGVPDPRQPATEEIDQPRERLQGLAQAGWHIDYTLYVAVGPDWVPSRLTLQRDAVRVRLVVDDWQL
jgi:outer membrane lipoprotein LolB